MKINLRSLSASACLLILTVSVTSHASGRINLSRTIIHCASIDDSKRRLECYDELARDLSLATSQPQVNKFIKPPESFLDSRLVDEPWKTEFTLTVKSFEKLIAQAVMENRKHVTVQGWSREKDDYVLHITMNKPVKLHFKPRDTAGGGISMSLLRDVKMDGYVMNASQFIITIASMYPDNEPTDTD